VRRKDIGAGKPPQTQLPERDQGGQEALIASKEFCDTPYIDDFFLGYLVAAGPTDRKKILDEVQKENRQEPFRSISKVTLCL
jgi:hypothetical protein